MSNEPAYLLAGQTSELERLQLQSRVWEPAGEQLLGELDVPRDAQVLDVGCGAMGWLRALRRTIPHVKRVVGSDIDDRMLDAARTLVATESLDGIDLVRDDLFDSRLPAGQFDLVHARFQIAPLGRAAQQLRSSLSLLKSGGLLVLEEPDAASWQVHPEGTATARLIEMILKCFEAGGGDFNAGRVLPAAMREHGIEPRIRAHVIGLEPGHPYLRLPLQFGAALKPRLQEIMSSEHLDALLVASQSELAHADAWGTTFTLIQVFGQKP